MIVVTLIRYWDDA